MVKLASAREIRLYGPRLVRNRSEYMNAGLYVFATVVLLMGFVAQIFSREPKSGLVLLLIAIALIATVNIHDLLAHLAAFHFRLTLMEYDAQLALVEFLVPLLHTFGSFLSFFSILFFLIQEEKALDFYSWEKHALNMLIAGSILWLIGSIHNSCQIYERADGHVQILQQSVHIPFLMASLLFVVAALINSYEQSEGHHHHGLILLGKTWAWLGICGSFLLFIGGLLNVVKVFKMQQMNGLRLEKLRGGAQERLIQEQEGGQIPLFIEENISSRRFQAPEPKLSVRTPYKDAFAART